jgi:hypothetical protein
VLTPSLASAIGLSVEVAGATHSERISMQDVKPSLHYLVESDHQRESAQVSADPSCAFDGDGEPRFDAARSSGERLHWRCHHEGECIRFREGPMPSCSGTCLMLAASRSSGVETVRAELAGGAVLLSRASHLYATHACSLAAHYKSGDSTPWSELSAPTVRAWVAVAREAARP